MILDSRKVSELEGAILSEIEHRGNRTAFQVRRAFADSFSLEWQGSAGGVYPAVRRLIERGLLLASEAKGGRASRQLSLSESGMRALADWAADASRASSIGVDPFRLRAGIWATWPRRRRLALFRRIDASIEENIRALVAYAQVSDLVERIRIDLALAVQKARRELLKHWST